MLEKPFPRRDFLKGTGALVVSFSFSGALPKALAQTAGAAADTEEPTSLDSWLAVAQDGTVTVYTSKVELGTGVETALAQIVAEELDLPLEKVVMYFGDTDKSVDQATTAASRTLERGGPQLRQAAAAGRQELLKMASAQLDAPVDQLRVTDGVISAAGSSKKVTYGELIGGRRFNVKITATGHGWDMKVAPEVPRKDYKDYKIVGKSIPRRDLPPKFTGEFTYIQDVKLPGMLHGRVVRPATVNSKPDSIDQSSISSIPGVVKVVQEGSFVGVVAQTEWAAIRAARALKISWSTPSTKIPDGPDAAWDYLRNTKSFLDQKTVERGDVNAAMAQAAKTLDATFRWPFQLHGMMAPSCAVADVQGDRATIYSGCQGPFDTRKQVAHLLGVPEKNVHVLYREASGCYGRLEPDDAPLDAALLSRAVGKPVRVQWMREDEHGWEPKGPAQLVTLRAGLDAQGKIVAWEFLDRSFPWTESLPNPLLAARQAGLKAAGPGRTNGNQSGGEFYQVDNIKVGASEIPWVFPEVIPLRTSNLRAPGELARCFASEGFFDEIAATVKADPLAMRLQYLGDNPRAVAVLQAAAKQAGWASRPSPNPSARGTVVSGRGIALSDRSNTMVAAVAEVEVNKSTGKIAVKRIVLAHDCGLIVNPDGLTNQIQGNVIQGVSRALMEEVKFDAAGVHSLDWRGYPIIRYTEVPDVDVVLINHPEMQPLGGGEPSIVPVTAAIANAVFDATGTRVRQVPMTPQRILAAMRGSESVARSA